MVLSTLCRFTTGRRILIMGVASALALTAASVSSGPAQAKAPGRARTPEISTPSDKAKFYDSRKDPAPARVLRGRAAQLSARPSGGVAALRTELGRQGVVSMDPLTGTARSVSRLDGFLTGASGRPADAIARDYVRAHPDVFGLDAAGVSGLTLRRDYVDIAGSHHLSYVQSVAGVPVFGNGLQANVAGDGRLINVVGSPVAGLPSGSSAPAIPADRARVAAVTAVRETPKPATAKAQGGARQTTVFSNGDRAELVYFMTVNGLRLAWQTQTRVNHKEVYSSVVDAASGQVLYRRSLVESDNGLAWDYYPGAAKGGVQKRRDFTGPGWLPDDSPWLAGNVAHVYNDANDDDVAQRTEEIRPSGHRQFQYPFTNFNSVDPRCSAQFPCSWDPKTANSWQTNRNQDGVQVFYYLGRYHDHLRDAPIGFTRAAGNFEAVDGDAVQGQIEDGSNTADGLPDEGHIDNANMATFPDGQPPVMQMYLFNDPFFPDDFPPTNGGDEADIVYHEYTHGLSNRLVVDALGNSTLGGGQAGAMGEAWSDWYAMDFLNNLGVQPDTAAPGEVRIGNYVGGGADLIRSQPIDCPVGSTSPKCPGFPDTVGPGGYTYGDYSRILFGFHEVHLDGEIWGETLWDLRTALGSRMTESLVTRAMELSPANPSFLDERNAILQADQVVDNGKANAQIWKVFAARGMGWFASTTDGDDQNPIEDFSAPPPAGTPTGSLIGTVTDAETGAPVQGAAVGFFGHASGFPGDLAAVSDATGHYTIDGIIPGTYPAVFARSDMYAEQQTSVSVGSHPTVLNWALHHDWAAQASGGSVAAFNGPDNSQFGCGPDRAIDVSLRQGWESDSDVGPDNTSRVPKFITVKLPRALNISAVAVDPGAICDDGYTASTKGYRLETSVDGVTFTVASTGAFGADDRHRLNSVPLAAGSTAGINYVRFTMLSTQLPDGADCAVTPYFGCFFMDLAELEVYGTVAP